MDELPTLPAGDITYGTDDTLTVGGVVVDEPGRYRYSDTGMVLTVAPPDTDEHLVDVEH